MAKRVRVTIYRYTSNSRCMFDTTYILVLEIFSIYDDCFIKIILEPILLLVCYSTATITNNRIVRILCMYIIIIYSMRTCYLQ